MSSKFICIVVHEKISFFLRPNNIPLLVYATFFSHSFPDGHLGCTHGLTIVVNNNNVSVQIPFQDPAFSSSEYRCRTAGLWQFYFYVFEWPPYCYLIVKAPFYLPTKGAESLPSLCRLANTYGFLFRSCLLVAILMSVIWIYFSLLFLFITFLPLRECAGLVVSGRSLTYWFPTPKY